MMTTEERNATTRSLNLPIPGLATANAEKQKQHNEAVERNAAAIERRDSREDLTIADVRTMKFIDFRKFRDDHQQRMLGLLQERQALAESRKELLEIFEASLTKDQEAAESEFEKAWKLVEKGLQKVGVTVENHKAYAVNPDGARNEIARQIRATPSVRTAQAALDDATLHVNRVREVQKTCDEVIQQTSADLFEYASMLLS